MVKNLHGYIYMVKKSTVRGTFGTFACLHQRCRIWAGTKVPWKIIMTKYFQRCLLAYNFQKCLVPPVLWYPRFCLSACFISNLKEFCEIVEPDTALSNSIQTRLKKLKKLWNQYARSPKPRS